MKSLPVAEFDRLFSRQRSALEFYAQKRVSREEAEDLVSACYLQAREALVVYQAERSLLTWLTGILENLLRSHFRRVRIRREDLLGDNIAWAESEDSTEREAARQQGQRRRLYQCLGRVDMPSRRLECLLRTLSGESHLQISRSLHISRRMVNYHVHAAQQDLLAFMRVKVENDGEDTWGDDWDPVEFFYECAHRPIYHKPHSFDNQSNSVEREQHRYAYLREGNSRGKRGTRVKEHAYADSRFD